MEEQQKRFIQLVSKLYGSFDADQKKFDKASNAEIARHLGYSDAQFSRLINAHATEGEYERACRNVSRILQLIEYEDKFEKISINPNSALASTSKRVMFFIAGLIIGSVAAYFIFYPAQNLQNNTTRYDLLKWSFESNFINPYQGIRDLPDDCNYQCYKYQGKWQLKEEYKLPFLREKSGFHYVAKEAVMYARCTPENNPNGNAMEGYEYQKHEIWYDVEERPISTFIDTDGTPKEFYKNLKLTNTDNFVMIGTIHSFYYNDFNLDSTTVQRKGQDIGRDLELVSDENLADKLGNAKLLRELQDEIRFILQEPLEDYSQPSECAPSQVPRKNFPEIQTGDEMTFYCRMTSAERFPIGYIKTYSLSDQFIKDVCITKNQ